MPQQDRATWLRRHGRYRVRYAFALPVAHNDCAPPRLEPDAHSLEPICRLVPGVHSGFRLINTYNGWQDCSIWRLFVKILK